MSFFVGKRPSNGKPLLHINSVTPLNGSIQEAPDENTIFHSDLPFIFVDEYTASTYIQHNNVNGITGHNYREFAIPSQVKNALVNNQVVLISGITDTNGIVGMPQTIESLSVGRYMYWAFGQPDYQEESNFTQLVRGATDMSPIYLDASESVPYATSVMTQGYWVAKASVGGFYEVFPSQKPTKASGTMGTALANELAYNKDRGLTGSFRHLPIGPKYLQGSFSGVNDIGQATIKGIDSKVPLSSIPFITSTTSRILIPNTNSLMLYKIGTRTTRTRSGYLNKSYPGAYNPRLLSTQESTFLSPLGGIAVTKLKFTVLNIKNTTTGFSYIPTSSGSSIELAYNKFKIGDLDLQNTRIIAESSTKLASSMRDSGTPTRSGYTPLVSGVTYSTSIPSAENAVSFLPATHDNNTFPTKYPKYKIDPDTLQVNNLSAYKTQRIPNPLIQPGGGTQFSSDISKVVYGSTLSYTTLEVMDIPSQVGSWKIDSRSLSISKGNDSFWSTTNKPLKFLGNTYSFSIGSNFVTPYISKTNREFTLASWDIGATSAKTTIIVSVTPSNYSNLVPSMSLIGGAQGWGSCFNSSHITGIPSTSNIYTLNNGDSAVIYTSKIIHSDLTFVSKDPKSYLPQIFSSLHLTKRGNFIDLKLMPGQDTSIGDLIGLPELKINFMRLT